MNRCTSVCFSPLVVTVTGLSAANGKRRATSPFSCISNTVRLTPDFLRPSVGASSRSAAFTFSVTVFGPGPSFLTRSLNIPSFVGVNVTLHFGPGLVSLPTSLLSPSWMNKCTSVSFSPLVVTVTGLPAANDRRTATSPFSLISNTLLLNADPLPASLGLSSSATAAPEATNAHPSVTTGATQYLTFIHVSFGDGSTWRLQARPVSTPSTSSPLFVDSAGISLPERCNNACPVPTSGFERFAMGTSTWGASSVRCFSVGLQTATSGLQVARCTRCPLLVSRRAGGPLERAYREILAGISTLFRNSHAA